MAISSFKRSGLSRVTSPKAAVISGTPTGTYSSGGKNYSYFQFTGNGSLTVVQQGYADVLVLGGGGGCNSRTTSHGCGGSGNAIFQAVLLPVATHTVTIGGGGAGNASFAAPNGAASSIGTIVIAAGGQGGYSWDSAFGGNVPATHDGAGGNARGFCINIAGTARGAGSGGLIYGSDTFDGLSNSITGSAVTYGTSLSSGNGTANRGEGAGATSGAGGSGIVIVRVEV